MMLEYAARTDAGLKRPLDESVTLARPELGLFAIAYGAGGHCPGKPAAELGLAELSASFDLSRALAKGFKQAAEATKRKNDNVGHGEWACATACGIHLVSNSVEVAHIGDSRVYRFAAGRLQPLTVDHSLTQQMLAEGKIRPEEVANHPYRYVSLRMWGTSPSTDSECETFEINGDEVFLLSTFGLHQMISNSEIESILNSMIDLDSGADALVAAANQAGGRSNIAVLLVRVKS